MHRDHAHIFDPRLPEPGYVPRHRLFGAPAEASVATPSPERLDPIEAFRSTTGTQPGELPRIRSYNDLGRDQLQDQDTSPRSVFEIVFAAGDDGPAIEPLLGPRARKWRPGHWFTNAVAALLGAGLAVAVVCSPITAMAFEDAYGTDKVWTAQFTGTDTGSVSIADVTCEDLFSEVVKGSTVVNGAPAEFPPLKVSDPIVLGEQLDEIAALPKGDIGREAIVCQGTAYWSGEGARRIVTTLTVAGGEAGPATMSSKVARSTKKAQKKT